MTQKTISEFTLVKYAHGFHVIKLCYINIICFRKASNIWSSNFKNALNKMKTCASQMKGNASQVRIMGPKKLP